MRLTQLIPMAAMGGLGYTQRAELGELMEAPIDIARVVATQHELGQIRKLFLLEVIGGTDPVRVEQDFPEWMRNHFHSETRDTSLDYWNNPYQMHDEGEDFLFWSLGPDEEDDTEDDVWLTVAKSTIGA
jgi:hypothetical protein